MSNDLQSFHWLCRLVSPFSTTAQLEAEMPETIRWESMIAAASAHFIAPFVHPALEQHQLLDRVPALVRDALEGLHLLNAQRNVALTGQIERISGMLNRAEIEPVWLKGAACLIEESRWSSMRAVSDLDLWVPEHLALHTMDTLRAAGYSRPEPYTADITTHHHFAPLCCDTEPAMIEVHRSLVERNRAQVLPLDQLLANAQFLEWRGKRAGVPSKSGQILNIISQDSIFDYLRGNITARRPLEFINLCHEYGTGRALQMVRDAYRDTDETAFVEQYFSWAAALYGLPGEFPARGLTDAFNQRASRFLFSVRHPKLGALWDGCQALRYYLAAHPVIEPKVLLSKLARRSWKALRRTKVWD